VSAVGKMENEKCEHEFIAIGSVVSWGVRLRVPLVACHWW